MAKAYRPSKKTLRKKPYKKRASKKVSFAKRVMKVMSTQIENKNHQLYATNQALVFASAGGLNPTALSLVPGLSQGVGQGSRIGNEVIIKRAYIKGYVNMLPYNSLTNECKCPVYVKMWLCKRKTGSPGITGPPVSSDYNQFFAVGSSAVGFQNSTLDLVFSINRDYWTVYAQKTIQLQNYTSAVPVSGMILGQSSSVSVPFSFNFTKHLGKLKWNDTTSSQTTNKELFLIFQNVFSDGSSGGISSTEIHYNIEWIYEDA